MGRAFLPVIQIQIYNKIQIILKWTIEYILDNI